MFDGGYFSCYHGSTLLGLPATILKISGEESSQHAVNLSRGTCDTIEKKSTGIHFLINILATLILGTSNTYQQIATSLTGKEFQRAIQKAGNARVGTNSPTYIRFKRPWAYRWKSYLSWVFLLGTSLPIHLLANSVIGPSYYAPALDVFRAFENKIPSNINSSSYLYPSNNGFMDASSCWFAFTTDKLSIWDYNENWFDNGDALSLYYQIMGIDSVQIYSPTECQLFAKIHAKNLSAVFDGWDYGQALSINANLLMKCAYSISCETNRSSPKCSLTLRMSAALTLAACLTAKAVYMLVFSYYSRGNKKETCLSFGDVIATSVYDRKLQLPNECMVNADTIHRRAVQHTCHKHCKDASHSPSGDEIGHCQKCSKFNKTNHASGLENPAVAIKNKKALITTLGGASDTQMLVLTIISLLMIVVSCIVAASQIGDLEAEKQYCAPGYMDTTSCEKKKQRVEWDRHTGIGGLNSTSLLSLGLKDSIQSELLAFLISNGAQLIYSVLYLLLIYNMTLISMERDWGALEKKRSRLRGQLLLCLVVFKFHQERACSSITLTSTEIACIPVFLLCSS